MVDALHAAVADAGGLDDVVGDLDRRSAARHGRAGCRRPRHPPRPALERHPQRPGRRRPDRRGGRRGVRAAHRKVPVASFTITKLRWLRDHEPDNAARVAAVALPHDWLTWRLRGFGPAGESASGRTSTRSRPTALTRAAPPTGIRRPATTTWTCSRARSAAGPRKFGTATSLLPTVLDPGGRAGTVPEFLNFAGAARRGRRGGHGRQRRRRARPRRHAGRRRRLARHQRHRLRRHRRPVATRPAPWPGSRMPRAASSRSSPPSTRRACLDAIAALLGVDHAELGRPGASAPSRARTASCSCP